MHKIHNDGVYTSAEITGGMASRSLGEMLADLGPVIYYLRLGDLIKIGFTTNLHNRIKQYPPGVKLLAWRTDATIRDEQALHRRLKHHVAERYEWYHATPAVIAEVREARDACGISACLRK